MRLRRIVFTLLVAAVVALVAGVATAPARPKALLQSADGIHLISQSRLDSRLIALTASTHALRGPVNIRILLPTGYAEHPRRRYPVLYLLHGTSGGAADWTTLGEAEQTTAGRQLIVVMPDIGQHYDGGSYCTDWYNGGHYGQPRWETFHIDQLIPWVDHNLRTVADRDGRAIAGLSQGGFCAMSYAARHPDLFGAALSFSGVVDTAYDAVAQALMSAAVAGAEKADGAPPNSMFGPRDTEELNWAAHDPTTVASNLRGMRLWIYTGNGQAGPFDPPVPNPVAAGIETTVHILSTSFHDRLQALRIPSHFDDYGPGTHSWPYWARDLRWSIGPLMANFAHPPAAPHSVTYTSADPIYSQFGWHVKMIRRVAEFSTLQRAGRAGFTLLGSGRAIVTTPSFYKPGRRYIYRIHGTGFAAIGPAFADKQGRLKLYVPLGHSNTVQEYPNDGPPTATRVYMSRVTISRTPAAH